MLGAGGGGIDVCSLVCIHIHIHTHTRYKSLADVCTTCAQELERLAGQANKKREGNLAKGGFKKRSESHAALQAMMAPSDFYNPQQVGILRIQKKAKRCSKTAVVTNDYQTDF